MNILIIDDDKIIRQSVRLNLEQYGYECDEAETAIIALENLKDSKPDIILCDLKLPGMDGISFTKKCKALEPEIDIVIMTGFGNSSLAIEAIRAGAQDYISKPFDVDELILTIRKIEERKKILDENAQLKREIEGKYNFSNIIAKSKAMRDVFETVKRLAAFNTTVLIRGESGTGKELLAKAVHHNSPRKKKAFIAINCAAIPENLMESELFGHKKGAFTDASRDKPGLFKEADGGTIFLDEIGEMPQHLQVKLLRVLQEKQIQPVGDENTYNIDVRVVAATLRDLEQDVQDKRFRDDLYYRLNVVSIYLPALRERSEDIVVLAEHFLKKYNKKLKLSVKRISDDAMRCLLKYNWKGNVRELENCIERALVLTETNEIDLESLPDHISAQLTEPEAHTIEDDSGENESLSIKQRTKTLEKNLIMKALQKNSGNRTHAAKELEISHRALLYKIKEYELSDFMK